MITGELANDPVAAEATETGVLLAAKGTGRGIVDAVIIDMGHSGMETEAQKRTVYQLWRQYSFLRAVERDAVFPVSADYFITPGPRIGQAVRDIRKMIWSSRSDSLRGGNRR